MPNETTTVSAHPKPLTRDQREALISLGSACSDAQFYALRAAVDRLSYLERTVRFLVKTLPEIANVDEGTFADHV